jgi:hypothetical protein
MKYILKHKSSKYFGLFSITYTFETDNIHELCQYLQDIQDLNEVTIMKRKTDFISLLLGFIAQNAVYIVFGMAVIVALLYLCLSYFATGVADYKPLKEIIIESP